MAERGHAVYWKPHLNHDTWEEQRINWEVQEVNTELKERWLTVGIVSDRKCSNWLWIQLTSLCEDYVTLTKGGRALQWSSVKGWLMAEWLQSYGSCVVGYACQQLSNKTVNFFGRSNWESRPEKPEKSQWNYHQHRNPQEFVGFLETRAERLGRGGDWEVAEVWLTSTHRFTGEPSFLASGDS